MNSPTSAPRLIAFDLDGTLNSTQHRPLESSLRAIAAAQADGIQIMIASGRDAWALRGLLEGFGVDPTRLVFLGANGSRIVDGATGETLWCARIEPEVLTPLMAHLRTFPISPLVPDGPHLYTEDAGGFHVQDEAAGNGQQVVEVPGLDTLPAPVPKILIAGPADVLAAQNEAIAAPFRDRLDFFFSWPILFECMPRGVNKGSSLRRFCAMRGIDLADVVAFGDNENDIEMLQAAGLGVAMGNALPHVKDAADLVTADNDSDGIAQVLQERFGLG